MSPTPEALACQQPDARLAAAAHRYPLNRFAA
jgi:hypothetical protein